MIDPILIVAAFIFGTITSKIGLPPLVGYLVAGFILNSMGVETGDALQMIADAGVTLLLFTIGLKLKIKTLARSEIWAGTTIHMTVTVIVFAAGLALLGKAGLPRLHLLDRNLCLLIAFALSFSSTVFAVKVFEEKKEMASRHAVQAVGILVMQDIIAVLFLTISSGKTPSLWALPMIGAIFLLRPIFFRFMSRCGHGELLMLFGILLPFAGYATFDLVGLKGDLGALVFGILVAGHPRAQELADTLLSFKNLFLVGFFLSIGISGSPTLADVGVALLLALAMPFKAILFFGIFSRFNLRARTALLSSLSLANYSEFGLIVGAIAVANGWLEQQWLYILAIALSLTFVMAAPANSFAHAIYARWSLKLKRFESDVRLPEEAMLDYGDAKIAVLGMGGVGTAAYDEMRRNHGDVVIGVDFSKETVTHHIKNGRNVVLGDASDSDFWDRIEPSANKVKIIMMTLPDPGAAAFAVKQLHAKGYDGQITASVRYEDEAAALKRVGIDKAYVLYEEAGVGFAHHVCKHMDHCHLQEEELTS